MSPIIEFRDVSKVFPSPSGPIRAVDGVDLTIEAGEMNANARRRSLRRREPPRAGGVEDAPCLTGWVSRRP